jgi:uncharacterized protein YcbK (DUF882 family)
MIDWSDPKAKISRLFVVKEALNLPQWKRIAEEKDGLDDQIKQNLVQLFEKIELVRAYFGKPIIVHCAYRPPEYNKLVKGASKSAHVQGMAVDFHVQGMDCDEVRKMMVDNGKLDEWGMRCEDMPGSNWVHLDIREPGSSGKRFFKP